MSKAIAFLSASVLTGAALAAPITMHIPVSLSNMHPDVHRVSIFCRVFDDAGRSFAALRSPPPQQSFPIVDGAYDGTITVEGGADLSEAERAHSYRCSLSFSIVGLGGTHNAGQVPGENYSVTPYVEERLRHDTSAAFTHYITGDF